MNQEIHFFFFDKCEPGDTLIDVNHKIGVLTTKAAVDKESVK